MTAINLVYPIFAVLMIGFALLMIPRKLFKEYFMYGFLMGGLADVVITKLSGLLGIFWFENQGIFNVLGLHALSPICWTLVMMLFLFFLPERLVFRIAYLCSWSLLAVGFGYVVHNAGLFYFKSWFYPIGALFVFAAWWAAAAWLYCKTSSLVKDGQTPN